MQVVEGLSDFVISHRQLLECMTPLIAHIYEILIPKDILFGAPIECFWCFDGWKIYSNVKDN